MKRNRILACYGGAGDLGFGFGSCDCGSCFGCDAGGLGSDYDFCGRRRGPGGSENVTIPTRRTNYCCCYYYCYCCYCYGICNKGELLEKLRKIKRVCN